MLRQTFFANARAAALLSSMGGVSRQSLPRALTVKGIPPIDREASKQELVEVSKQIEDAMHKEKSVHDAQQVNKFHKTFDAASQNITEPDLETQQSKTQEMDAIFTEQVKLDHEKSLHGQGQNTPKTDAEKNNDYQLNNEGLRGRKGYAARDKEPLPTDTGVMDAVKQSAQSLKQTGHDLKEAAKGSMKDMADMAKKMMNTPADEADRANAKKGAGNNPTAADLANDPDKQKKAEQFSNNRQNSSIL
jgi:hypothetical protein